MVVVVLAARPPTPPGEKPKYSGVRGVLARLSESPGNAGDGDGDADADAAVTLDCER